MNLKSNQSLRLSKEHRMTREGPADTGVRERRLPDDRTSNNGKIGSLSSNWMYIGKLYKFIKQRVTFYFHRIRLNRIHTTEDFYNYISMHCEEFLFYRNLSDQKREEVFTIIDKLSINLEGIRFLDLGAGYGDFIDICHERGGKTIEFTEIDPIFHTFNRLKGFAKGYQIDHTRGLKNLGSKKYDLIWVKGSITADHFNRMGKIWRNLGLSNHPVEYWVNQLEKLASPQCKIIICPHWLNDGDQRFIEDVRNDLFTVIMQKKGYILLSDIPHHNCEPEYPITYYKDMSLNQ